LLLDFLNYRYFQMPPANLPFHTVYPTFTNKANLATAGASSTDVIADADHLTNVLLLVLF